MHKALSEFWYNVTRVMYSFRVLFRVDSTFVQRYWAVSDVQISDLFVFRVDRRWFRISLKGSSEAARSIIKVVVQISKCSLCSNLFAFEFFSFSRLWAVSFILREWSSYPEFIPSSIQSNDQKAVGSCDQMSATTCSCADWQSLCKSK